MDNGNISTTDQFFFLFFFWEKGQINSFSNKKIKRQQTNSYNNPNQES